MNYYEVLVCSPKYHGETALTYQWPEKIETGHIVTVPLRNQTVPAIVLSKVDKPSFNTKKISDTVPLPQLPINTIKLAKWIHEYYPAPLGQIMSLFMPSDIYKYKPPDIPKITDSKVTKRHTQPKLTNDQKNAFTQIVQAYPTNILLHGDTGTGKTRLYLELAQKQIKKNKSVIILTPEIGLTSQLVESCEQMFHAQTVLIHSGLSPKQKRDTWVQILQSKEPLIVVGPRSALFCPLDDIGLVIVDESHDNAYKQDQSPRYVASRVAGMLTSLHSSQLILGSATPLVNDYYTFEQKHLPIVRMTQPAVEQDTTEPVIKTIDLKNLELFTKSRWLSNELLQAITDNLSKKEQSLVFLNRRGTARQVLCQNCGWQDTCPRCDLPLTYHGDTHQVQCHTCGYKKQPPLICASCKGSDLIYRTVGTKAIFDELKKLFPEARVQRFDGDSAKSEQINQNFENIKSGDIDILVGTQILGKGLDLPKLSVLGVVVADTGLSFPDYTSEEQTFQLLSQVIGRIGRGHLAGKAFIQTYQHDNSVISNALSKDYQSFYQRQLLERKTYRFPPFFFTLKLWCSRATSNSAQNSAQKLFAQLASQKNSVELTGPAPAFIAKNNKQYRWQIIVKAKDRQLLVKICKNLPAGWSFDLDPSNLL